jgi:hypothetical protein
MTTLAELIPDPDTVLALEPEELTGVALELLSSSGPNGPSRLHPSSFTSSETIGDYPANRKQGIEFAVNRGLAVACPGGFNRPQPRIYAWLAFHYTSRKKD